jgi:transposase
MNKPLKQQVIDAYLKRKISYRELSRIYGINWNTISGWIRTNGIKTTYFKELPEQEIVDLYSHLSVEKIAKQFNVSVSPIKRILAKNGVTIRDNSERHIGQKAWNKGIPLSEDQKKLLSKIASKKIGNKNPNWKGGKPKTSNPIRHTKEYKAWERAIKARDCKCLWCKSIERLEAHHIIPIGEDKDFALVFLMDNGITLCRKCHKKVYRKEHEYKDIFHNLLKKSRELRENPKGQS